MTRSGNRPALITSGVVAVVAAILSGVVWYQFLRDDAPPPVSLTAALAGLPTATVPVDNTAAPSAPATSIADNGASQRGNSTVMARATADGAATTEPATDIAPEQNAAALGLRPRK